MTETALFSAYKNLTQSALFFCEYPPLPPSANFKISMKNRVTQSVKICVYKKRNANCLSFFEVSGFLYLKTSRNAKSHAFCIYCMDEKSDHKVGIYYNLIFTLDQS